MISAYLKPTNRCNVGCTHCYLPEAVRHTSERMEMSVLRSAAAFLAEMQTMARHDSTMIVWHGGEPLVVSPDFYFAAGAILDAALPGHRETIQTSLIPFRKEFVPLVVERFGGLMGSSVDFSHRQLKGSVDAYLKLFMKKVDLARTHAITIAPGLVPSIADIGREGEIVRWFVDHEFPAFALDRYNAYGTSFPDRPSNRQHAQFLSNLLDALLIEMDRAGSAPVVGAIRAGINGVLFGRMGDRWGGSCTSDFVVVEPDGSLNNCPDKSTVETPFGTVAGGYKAFAADKFRRHWIRRQATEHQNDHCAGCENFSFCRTGCVITPNTPETEDGECSGYYSYLKHVREIASQPGGRDILLAYAQQKPLKLAESVYDQAVAAKNSIAGGACQI